VNGREGARAGTWREGGRAGKRRAGSSLVVVLAAAAVLLAGCSGPAAYSFGQYPTTTTPGVTLATEHSPVGPIVATGSGYTLYDFVPDSPDHSACVSATCVLLWPPVTVTGKPTVGSGLRAALVTTFRRGDGSTQVSYGGHPLYRWNGDTQQGMVTGQGVVNEGGAWYVVAASGKQVTTSFTIGGP
jgi:predicted lipoprotein with Yx(FWY)xxD motif